MENKAPTIGNDIGEWFDIRIDEKTGKTYAIDKESGREFDVVTMSPDEWADEYIGSCCGFEVYYSKRKQ